jgi:hypothetical protein
MRSMQLSVSSLVSIVRILPILTTEYLVGLSCGCQSRTRMFLLHPVDLAVSTTHTIIRLQSMERCDLPERAGKNDGMVADAAESPHLPGPIEDSDQSVSKAMERLLVIVSLALSLDPRLARLHPFRVPMPFGKCECGVQTACVPRLYYTPGYCLDIDAARQFLLTLPDYIIYRPTRARLNP